MRFLIGPAVFLGVAAPMLGLADAAVAQAVPGHCVTACQPGFNFYVGGLMIQRSTPDDAAIATPPTGTPGVLIDAAYFRQNMTYGGELVGQWRTAGGWTIEGRYFTTAPSSATHLVPAVTSFRIAGIGVTILGGGSINSTYSSTLSNNGELNAYRQLTPGIAVLAGARTISFNDTLHNDIATPVTYTQWSVDNMLVGGQVGVRVTMIAPTRPFQLDAAFKLGIYRNAAENLFTSTIVGGDQDNQILRSGLGEIMLGLSYQLNDNVAFRAGYEGLFLGNVGLAGETAEGTTQGPGGTQSLIRTGNVWYHGATLGLALTY